MTQIYFKVYLLTVLVTLLSMKITKSMRHKLQRKHFLGHANTKRLELKAEMWLRDKKSCDTHFLFKCVDFC